MLEELLHAFRRASTAAERRSICEHALVRELLAPLCDNDDDTTTFIDAVIAEPEIESCPKSAQRTHRLSCHVRRLLRLLSIGYCAFRLQGDEPYLLQLVDVCIKLRTSVPYVEIDTSADALARILDRLPSGYMRELNIVGDIDVAALTRYIRRTTQLNVRLATSVPTELEEVAREAWVQLNYDHVRGYVEREDVPVVPTSRVLVRNVLALEAWLEYVALMPPTEQSIDEALCEQLAVDRRLLTERTDAPPTSAPFAWLATPFEYVAAFVRVRDVPRLRALLVDRPELIAPLTIERMSDNFFLNAFYDIASSFKDPVWVAACKLSLSNAADKLYNQMRPRHDFTIDMLEELCMTM